MPMPPRAELEDAADEEISTPTIGSPNPARNPPTDPDIKNPSLDGGGGANGDPCVILGGSTGTPLPVLVLAGDGVLLSLPL